MLGRFGRSRLAILGAISGALVLGALAVGGVVMAQTGGGTPTPTPQAGQAPTDKQAGVDTFLNALAQNLGIDRGKLDTALKTTADQTIDAAVTSGNLTQDQANKLKQAVASGKLPLGFAGIAGRFGHDGKEGAKGAVLQGCAQAAQAAVSQALGGETADQIRAELRAGKSFDQIATEHGTTVQAIQNSVATSVKPCLDQAVTAGTITADQETKILDRIRNAKGPHFFFGGHRSGNGVTGETE